MSLPSATGGANWEGAAIDPETGVIYVPSRTALAVMSLGKDEDSDLDLSAAFGVRVPRVQGLEIVKPPYGRITAIDMNTGEHQWMIANADTPDRIKNHRLLEGVRLNAPASRHAPACWSPSRCFSSVKVPEAPARADFPRSR